MNKRIVWVDDDIDIIDPLVRPLEIMGYNILKYYSVPECMSAIHTLYDADLILLDMLMPTGMDKHGEYPGLDLLRHLKNDPKITAPILALTVVQNDDLYKNILRLGVVDILNKPIKPSTLKKIVIRTIKDAEK